MFKREVTVMKKRFLGRSSPCTTIIHFASVMCNEIKYCESKLEYDRLLTLEFDPTVRYYEAQPDPISYVRENGLTSRYTADVRVELTDGTYHIEEIKPYNESVKSEMLQKHALIRAQYGKSGIDFKIITNRDIYVGSSISNYRYLYRFLTEPIPPDLIRRFSEEFSIFCCSLIELQQEMKRLKYAPYELNLLMAHGYIQFNCQVKIDDNLEVFCDERTI